jgi:hypothetical protein
MERLVEFVVRSPISGCGWGNGYVAIPPKHPLHGRKVGDSFIYSLEVHGGITWAHKHLDSLYSKEFLVVNSEIPPGWWILGFDTGHLGDTSETWPKERVIQETRNLCKQLEKWME